MIRVSNLKFPLDFEIKNLPSKVVELLGLTSPLRSWQLVKKAVDTRSRQKVYFIYTVDITVDDEEALLAKSPWAYMEKIEPEVPLQIPTIQSKNFARPIIVGSGPAGMFAGLLLAQAGAKPLILERGKPVAERQKDVREFWHNRRLNPESNVQFGEGGAGTFSDGKLMTGIKKDAFTTKVLQEFVAAGAPEDIMYLAKPHLGTDKLAQIVPMIRQKIISLGGEYRFNHRLVDLVIKNGRLLAIKAATPEGMVEISADNLILAIGHSARDTFEMLYKRGIPLMPKAFSVGARIEHPQKLINQALQHNFAGNPLLGAADYKLAVHLPNGRSAYTFCMCPGGEVVAAASEIGHLATNGMSCYARDKANANSALLVGINPEDFGGSHPLQGMYYQRELEQKAFAAGGKTYQAPAQKVADLLAERPSKKFDEVTPSYSCGVVPSDLSNIFGSEITDTLRSAIVEMDKKLHGFALPSAVLTGVETRSSSPIRLLRDEKLQSPIEGLYPCGEGAGYAGGIVSAAVDGLKCALSVLNKLDNHKS